MGKVVQLARHQREYQILRIVIQLRILARTCRFLQALIPQIAVI